MTRLADQNLAEADPERWVEVLLHSHPAISRRVAMVQWRARSGFAILGIWRGPRPYGQDQAF
jgi:hypothetical protein